MLFFEDDPPPPKKARKPKADVALVIARYHDEYLRRFKVKPLIHGGKHGAMVKRLIAAYGPAETLALVDVFVWGNDRWAEKRAWSVEAFCDVAPRLMLARAGTVHQALSPRANGNAVVLRRALERAGQEPKKEQP